MLRELEARRPDRRSGPGHHPSQPVYSITAEASAGSITPVDRVAWRSADAWMTGSNDLDTTLHEDPETMHAPATPGQRRTRRAHRHDADGRRRFPAHDVHALLGADDRRRQGRRPPGAARGGRGGDGRDVPDAVEARRGPGAEPTDLPRQRRRAPRSRSSRRKQAVADGFAQGKRKVVLQADGACPTARCSSWPPRSPRSKGVTLHIGVQEPE